SGDDYSNRVAGLDGRLRLSDRHSLRFQYLESETEDPADIAARFGQPAGPFGGDAFSVDYDFDSRQWWAEAGYTRRDDGFRADAGFVNQVGYAESELGFGRVWHGDGDGWWNQMRLGMSVERSDDTAGQLLERRRSSWFAFNGPL